MSLAYKIDVWYKEKGIKLNFDPYKSIYRTWFGREIPVIFDGETGPGDATFNPKTKTIHLNESYAIKSLAKYLLHECGHANFNTGKSTLIDWTMLPSLYLSFEYFKAILNKSQEQGGS